MLGETGLLILAYFLFGSMLQHFVGGGVGIQQGICVADADVKDSASCALPEAMRKDISSCFVSQSIIGRFR